MGWFISGLVYFLSFIEPYALDFAYWGGANTLVMALAVIGLLVLFLPKGFPGKLLGLALILPLVFYKPSLPDGVNARLYLLDVGQGLAVAFQSKDKVLLYDTGPGFASGNDAGELVIAPFLRSIGIKQINDLVVSHGDLDHYGGFKTITSQFKVDHVYASSSFIPRNKKIPMLPCKEGKGWRWGQIHFEFINANFIPAPDPYLRNGKNDTSCVLKITLGQQSILLPGDISKGSENYLLDHHMDQLPSAILIAAHHGSRTSSSKNFIEAVNPEYVLYATGFLNRYRHPAVSVKRRFIKAGVKDYNTAYDGAIWFDFYQNGKLEVHKQVK